MPLLREKIVSSILVGVDVTGDQHKRTQHMTVRREEQAPPLLMDIRTPHLYFIGNTLHAYSVCKAPRYNGGT